MPKKAKEPVVYKHYRGDNLSDEQFFDNALVDTFRIFTAKLSEFKTLFSATLKTAQLIAGSAEKKRIIDISRSPSHAATATADFKKLDESLHMAIPALLWHLRRRRETTIR